MTLRHSHISAMEKILPRPLREGVGGRGSKQDPCGFDPSPRPLPQGEGENFLRPTPHFEMCEFRSAVTGRGMCHRPRMR